MDLSAKMPAQMDSSLPAKMPAVMTSEAPAIGGGPAKAPAVPISRDSAQNDPMWENVDDKGVAWETADKKLGATWEATDRLES